MCGGNPDTNLSESMEHTLILGPQNLGGITDKAGCVSKQRYKAIQFTLAEDHGAGAAVC